MPLAQGGVILYAWTAGWPAHGAGAVQQGSAELLLVGRHQLRPQLLQPVVSTATTRATPAQRWRKFMESLLYLKG